MSYYDENYIKLDTPQYAIRATWLAAIGLQKVDGLTPSKYLYELADKNINGKLTFDEVEELLYQRQNKEPAPESVWEADLVSKRIALLLSEDAFSFQPTTLIQIHKSLFQDVLDEAGKIRGYNFIKHEPILNGDTVQYADFVNIPALYREIFLEERKIRYTSLSPQLVKERLSAFTTNIWQVHAFCEGNTRTTAVFLIKYLRSMGFQVDNTQFSEKALYFRNSLVRSSYSNYLAGVERTPEYLEKFFGNLLFTESHELTNKELICFQLFPEREWAYLDMDEETEETPSPSRLEDDKPKH